MNFNHKKQSYESSETRIIMCFFFLLFTPLIVAQTESNDNTNKPFFKYSNSTLAKTIAFPLSGILLMAFITIYTRYCTHAPSYTFDDTVNERSFSKTTRGLDLSVFETFPVLEYSVVKNHKVGKCVLECGVCLDEFEDGETLRLIPKCDHVFHRVCIDEWFESHATCPVCRANLVPRPDESFHRNPVHGNPVHIDQPQCDEPQCDEPQCDEPQCDEPQCDEPQCDELQCDEPQCDELEKVIVLNVPEEQVREKYEESNVILVNQTLDWIQSSRLRPNQKSWLLRSYSTGHLLIKPGENMERFTLRLPFHVREKIMQNTKLNRTRSMVNLRRELDREFKSDRFLFIMAPPFLDRSSSMKSSGMTNNAVMWLQSPTVNSTRLPV